MAYRQTESFLQRLCSTAQILALVATQGVFGNTQIAPTYLSVSRPGKNVDMTYITANLG
jgi:hypothetical protein